PGRNCVRLCLLVGLTGLIGCSANPRRAAAPRGPSASYAAMTKASEIFARGREAALAGAFDRAREYFARAIDALRPPSGPAPADPQLLDFSYQLYESALRYDALAGPAEEAGTSDGLMASELTEIAEPQASEQAIVDAKEAIASDAGAVTYDIPITVNDAVLKVLAAFQTDLHGVIGRGLARSGRYIPMIHRIFQEEGIPRDLAQIALIESSFLAHARSPMNPPGICPFMPRPARHPGHYGFDVQYEEPLEYETVVLDRPVHLRHLSSSVETLKSLNPELSTAITPRQPEGYELKVPVGSRSSVLLAFAAAPTVTF